MPFDRLKKMMGMSDTSPKGMGDVQRADEFGEGGRQLPTLEQGYSTPERTDYANSGPKQLRPTDPEEFERTQDLMERIGMMSGGIKNISNLKPGFSIPLDQIQKNLNRIKQPLGEAPVPKDINFLEPEDLAAILKRNIGPDVPYSGSKRRFK